MPWEPAESPDQGGPGPSGDRSTRGASASQGPGNSSSAKAHDPTLHEWDQKLLPEITSTETSLKPPEMRHATTSDSPTGNLSSAGTKGDVRQEDTASKIGTAGSASGEPAKETSQLASPKLVSLGVPDPERSPPGPLGPPAGLPSRSKGSSGIPLPPVNRVP
jgi:hypothetical protein